MNEVDRLKADIDKFWFMVQHGWYIEPREFFEREAPRNGFDSPLAMAAHHMWKRELKDRDPAGAAALEAQAQPAGRATPREGPGKLVAKWRDEVLDYPVANDECAFYAATAVRLCADELEAALRAPAEAPQAGTVEPAHLAALRELADDLARIVVEVSSRDGDATARQHQRAAAVRAAVAALAPEQAAQAPACLHCGGYLCCAACGQAAEGGDRG